MGISARCVSNAATRRATFILAVLEATKGYPGTILEADFRTLSRFPKG
jgi:hypothetical protein